MGYDNVGREEFKELVKRVDALTRRLNQVDFGGQSVPMVEDEIPVAEERKP